MNAVIDDRLTSVAPTFGTGHTSERPLPAIITTTADQESCPLAAAMLVQHQGGLLTKYISLPQRHQQFLLGKPSRSQQGHELRH
jgi:hypothetical protein